MSVKSTPAKKGTATKSRAELRAQLAQNITAIFANPETPVRLYNGLADAMLDILNNIPTKQLDTSEAYNLALLNEYAAAQEAGGTR